MHKHNDEDIDDLDFASLSIEELRRQAVLKQGAFEMVWKHGTVVQLWYSQDNKVVPYQVRLDEDDCLICAPRDDDGCIKKSNVPSPHDMALFAQPPPREDCPICFLGLPLQLTKQTKYYSCCGKVICLGCIVAAEDAGVGELCPFCRAPGGKESTLRMNKRIEANDPEALCLVGTDECNAGKYKRGMKLLQKSADLGLCTAHYSLGCAYSHDEWKGVKNDPEKARYHWETSAMAGHGGARYNLGVDEMNRGNGHISMKHLMVAAKAGYKTSLYEVKRGFVNGWVTKADLEETIRLYEESSNELKSEQRDKAAAKYPYEPRMR